MVVHLIKRYQRLFNTASVIIEILIFSASYLAATYIRFSLLGGTAETVDDFWTWYHVSASLLYGVVIVILFAFAGLYSSMRTKRFVREAGNAVLLNLIGIVLMTAFLYFTRLSDFSRLSILLFFIISTVLILIKRVSVRAVLRHYRKKGYNIRHVLVVGGGKLARQYARSIKANPQWGYKIKGYLAEQDSDALPHKRLGAVGDIDQLLYADESKPDEVIVALDLEDYKAIGPVLEACESEGVKASIIPYYNDYISSNLSIEVIGETKVLRIQEQPLDKLGNAFLKRATDIILAAVFIVITSSVMLVAAVGTKLSSPGPIIFKQTRTGWDRAEFTMYKFRSMRVNADQDTAWSSDEDPRKTRFGSFIRKYSVDELPQFFNVLKGDMSIVGPRPEIPHHVSHLRDEVPKYMMRHRIKPGITGWAQINGLRGDTSIEDRLKYDEWYIKNWSMALDMRIIGKTVFGGAVNSEKMV